MKNLIIGITAAALSLAACNSADNKPNDSKTSTDTSSAKAQNNLSDTKSTTPISGILTGYLQIKNALTTDNSDDAASGGKSILESMAKFNKATLSIVQIKAYQEVADDIKENAEHINENSGKIAHQREHFEMLSQDMYELVKAFNGMQILYKDHCPMYNNNKGAYWLSETKEIKNPYLGKKMPDCGVIQEEIK